MTCASYTLLINVSFTYTIYSFSVRFLGVHYGLVVIVSDAGETVIVIIRHSRTVGTQLHKGAFGWRARCDGIRFHLLLRIMHLVGELDVMEYGVIYF